MLFCIGVIDADYLWLNYVFKNFRISERQTQFRQEVQIFFSVFVQKKLEWHIVERPKVGQLDHGQITVAGRDQIKEVGSFNFCQLTFSNQKWNVNFGQAPFTNQEWKLNFCEAPFSNQERNISGTTVQIFWTGNGKIG